MSLRLGKFFHQSDEYWFNLQTICDFYELRKHAKEIVAPIKQDYRAVATQSAASKAAFETVAKTIRHFVKTAKATQGAILATTSDVRLVGRPSSSLPRLLMLCAGSLFMPSYHFSFFVRRGNSFRLMSGMPFLGAV